MTITKTVEIPAARRLIIEIPNEIPAGRAQVELKVIPFDKKEETSITGTAITSEVSSLEHTLKCLVGVQTPRSDRLLGAAANLGNITLEEIREERLAKYLK